MKNKKGDVAITILVIGVFAVCSLALLTFFISDFRNSNSFVGLDLMHKLNAQIDEYNFYKSQGISESDLNKIFEFKYEGDKKSFYLEKSVSQGSFFNGKKEVILFSVKYEVS